MLLFVAILVAVIVVISAVYLFLSKPDGDSVETPSPSDSGAVPDSPSPTESHEASTGTPSSSADGYTREETADGTVFHMTVPDAMLTYSVTVDEQDFELTDTDGRMLLESKTDRSGFLEISYIAASKAAELAPGFLDSYLDYNEFDQSGMNYIGSTEISGETVQVNDGKTQIKAWLVDTDEGALAVVIGYSLTDKDEAEARLEKMLDSLVIEP